MKNLLILFLVLIANIFGSTTLKGTETDSNADKLIKVSEQVIADRYIVVTKPITQTNATKFKAVSPAMDVASKYGAKVHHTYTAALSGFAATLSASALQALLQLDEVLYIEPDTVISTKPTAQNDTTNSKSRTGKQAANQSALAQKQEPVLQMSKTITFKSTNEVFRVPDEIDLWNLDRLDQHSNQRDGWYRRQFDGNGVHVYILDSGIRITHAEFEGRASHDFSAIDDGNGADDCDGHGTHVAGIAGGGNVGVARKVRLHSVRVLDCKGGGSKSTSIQGIEWVVQNHQRPAVANMSLGGGYSRVQNDTVLNAINRGITFVISSGNSPSTSSCNTSPGSTYEAITVGATGRLDNVSDFSSAGPCVDILAPGEEIWSADITSDNTYSRANGTSSAAPHVTGLVAQYLQSRPTASPYEVTDAVLRVATIDHAYNLYGEPNFIAHTITTTDCAFPLHRYATPGNHFYTTGWLELGGGRFGYAYEGVVGYVPGNCVSNRLPIHRYWNGGATDRFYTWAFAELGNGGNGWSYEGANFAMLSSPQSAFGVPTIPIYRYYSPVWTDHFYTTNYGELGRGNAEWQYEGVLGHLFSPNLRR